MTPAEENVVIVTLGNDLRGDDGAGILFGNFLSGSNISRKSPLQIIEAGDTPENYTAVIASMHPDMIIITDAMEFGGKPGDIMLAEGDRLAKESSSTHGSLRLFVDFLENTTSANIRILGFQPKSTSLGEDISPEVYESVKKAADMILSGDSILETVTLLSGEYC
ncbi:hydrogenase 3 maturation endopeptidase HyCI [Candidatus Latescibacterota bacterium]